MDYPMGNLQLVLRDDGVWAATTEIREWCKADYEPKKALSTFPACMRARATGCLDSIFFRANGGTVRVLTDNNWLSISIRCGHLAKMVFSLQEGICIGDLGCACQLSLYGNIALRLKKDPFTNRLIQPEMFFLLVSITRAVCQQRKVIDHLTVPMPVMTEPAYRSLMK